MQGMEPLTLAPVQIQHIVDGTTKTFLIGEYATTHSEQMNATGSAFWASTHSFHNLGAPQREHFTRIPDYDKCMRLTGNKHWQCDRSYASLHAGSAINFVFCDGSVHDDPKQQEEDQKIRTDLVNKGYRVVVIRYDRALDEQVNEYQDVFGVVRS